MSNNNDYSFLMPFILNHIREKEIYKHIIRSDLTLTNDEVFLTFNGDTFKMATIIPMSLGGMFDIEFVSDFDNLKVPAPPTTSQ